MRQTVPDRTDWFTLQDANKFTSDRKRPHQLSLQDRSRTSEDSTRGKAGQKSSLTADSVMDMVPIEIDVGLSVHRDRRVFLIGVALHAGRSKLASHRGRDGDFGRGARFIGGTMDLDVQLRDMGRSPVTRDEMHCP
jgi:hypothetical protein